MMSAVGPAGREWAFRPSSFAGMGNQALLNAFMEELRKQQAKSCERDVEEIKRAGMSDKLAGKQREDQEKESGKFTF